jgi:hypothetical protein
MQQKDNKAIFICFQFLAIAEFFQQADEYFSEKYCVAL